MATAEAPSQTDAQGMEVFPLLVDPEYEPNTFTYTNTANSDLPRLADWVEVFRSSIPTFQERAEQDDKVEDSVTKAKEFAQRFNEICDVLAQDPDAEVPPFGSAPINCLRLCGLRDGCLRNAGFRDPYAAVKAEETAKALKLLPCILEEADAVPAGRERLAHVIKGVFAGNVFDLGAAGTAEAFKQGGDAGAMFKKARCELKARPWAVDKFDEALDAFCTREEGGRGGYKKALVFVDNAGADVVLGVLPFLRELLRRGTAVVVAANEVPSINDVTAEEMRGVAASAARADSVFSSAVERGAFRVVSSGNDQPGIDLRRVSAAAATEAAAGVDLVVLEGMGRSIETNLYARFTVDALKLAMIKHPEVAQCLKSELYSPVCNFTPAAPSGGGGGGNSS